MVTLPRHGEAVAWRLAADDCDGAVLTRRVLLVDSELRAIVMLLVLIVGARNATMGTSNVIPARQSSALRRKAIGISNSPGDIHVLNMCMLPDATHSR